jgi:hypothetical protein
MVNDGIIQTIDGGFGSIHDTDTFIIAICDDCITENLEDGTLLLFRSVYQLIQFYFGLWKNGGILN